MNQNESSPKVESTPAQTVSLSDSLSRTPNKPSWWIDKFAGKVHHGCLNCGGTDETLRMDTRLYNGFGGWEILKDGELFFSEDPSKDKEWEEWKTLQEFEDIAKLDPEHDWRAVVFLPLRGATYQRHYGDGWILIESNQGFA